MKNWYKFIEEKRGWPPHYSSRECYWFRESRPGQSDDAHIFSRIAKAGIHIDYSKDFYYMDGSCYRGWNKNRGDLRIIKNGFHAHHHKTQDEIIDAVGKEFAFAKFEKYFHTPYKEYKHPKRTKTKVKNIMICEDFQLCRVLSAANYPLSTFAETWTEHISKKILDIIPDANIIIRRKDNCKVRRTYTLADQIKDDDIDVVVTFSSFAGLHAVLSGIPAVTLGPSCIDHIGNKYLSNLSNLYYPDGDEFKHHLLYLSCVNFSGEEIKNGIAWDKIQALQGENKWNPNTCVSCFIPEELVSWKNNGLV